MAQRESVAIRAGELCTHGQTQDQRRHGTAEDLCSSPAHYKRIVGKKLIQKY